MINKEKIYNRYIDILFGAAHPEKKLQKEYKLHARYFRRNYLPFFPTNKDIKILGLGCGMGHFLYFLEKEGYKNYLGIDVSDDEVALCQKNGFNAQKADIFDFLSDKSDIYDVITFNDVIEHLTKDEILKILELIYKALKKGGRVFIKTANMANFITGVGVRYIDITHEIGFTEESMREVCLLSGFSKIRIFGPNIYVLYFNPINYVAWFFSKACNLVMCCLCRMYGWTTVKIFTKNILAIAEK